MSSLLAISWEPELRGVLIVIIGVGVLCGSIYMVMATNLGIRLGFLVALTGLTGWMALMGLMWLIYGIGLTGPVPSWEPVPGRTVLQNTGAIVQAGALEQSVDVSDDAMATDVANAVAEQFDSEGWVTISESDTSFGQAASRAGELIEETGALAAGEYEVVKVFDVGGERYPRIGDSLDFVAFLHKPHYAVAEVAPLQATREEPGRAPAPAQIDNTRPRQYVYMIRNLGAERQPAAVLLIGSTIILVALAYLLHRRDAHVRRNREPAPSMAS
ncbi:MAG: hypothetical protein M3508_08635 [Actinomycetota bacterium]|nr:hypothetical protein [Actinomycetota bacterium]